MNAITVKPLEISKQEALALVASACESSVYHEVAVMNKQMVSDLLRASKAQFFVVKYTKGQTILTSGQLDLGAGLDYSYVPLGFIASGEVSVIKGEKATKQLAEGDFIGLFETSDWLLTKQKREIGDWTIIANTDVTILYFSEAAFEEESAQAKQFNSYLIELSRNDSVPQPVTQLPLLDWVAAHTTQSRLHDYVIVAHTHLLPNNIPFFRHLSYLVGFGRTFVLEKPYSTVPSAYHSLVQSGFDVVKVKMEESMPYEYASRKATDLLWSKVIELQKQTGFSNLLIVDDGGDLWTSIPWDALDGVKVAGVEQTQRGITRIQNSHLRIPPVVSVASSGVKKLVESEFIGESIVQKLDEFELLKSGRQIGILGMGSIGMAAFRALQARGVSALYYDPLSQLSETSDAEFSRSTIDRLINDSEIIIGTTGTDALKGIAFERIHGRKTFVSASSADVEFSALLQLALPTSDPFGVREVQVNDAFTAEILNGGYPLNFDRLKDATPSEDIVLTRALMYIGAMQAVKLIEDGVQERMIVEVDSVSQEELMKEWIRMKKEMGQDPKVSVDEISSIVNHSGFEGAEKMGSVWTAR